ncbi:hypothetical protein ECEC4402_5796, partial [Escherichia coli EC4402]
MSKHA